MLNKLMLNEITMTSLELVELINKLRKEEGNTVEKELLHKNLMASIRKELEVLESLGFNNGLNFKPVEYEDKKGEKRPCYKMNKAGIMQMLNKESAYVRYKTQEYIEALENRTIQLENKIVQLEKDIIHRTTNYELFIHHSNNRTLDLLSARYKQLKDSIASEGENKTPIIVNKLEDGRYLVIEGNHRLEACKSTNSVLRFIVDNTHTLEKAIAQETLTFNVWKNMSLFQYGVRKQVPMCLYIQELYTIYKDDISLDNLIQLATRFLSRKQFNLNGKYYSHDTFFNKLKTETGVNTLRQMEVNEADKDKLIECLDMFIEFYRYADWTPAVKDVISFLPMYMNIKFYHDTIIKNWKRVVKTRHTNGKSINIYEKIRIASYRNFAQGIIDLMNS